MAHEHLKKICLLKRRAKFRVILLAKPKPVQRTGSVRTRLASESSGTLAPPSYGSSSSSRMAGSARMSSHTFSSNLAQIHQAPIDRIVRREGTWQLSWPSSSRMGLGAGEATGSLGQSTLQGYYSPSCWSLEDWPPKGWHVKPLAEVCCALWHVLAVAWHMLAAACASSSMACASMAYASSSMCRSMIPSLARRLHFEDGESSKRPWSGTGAGACAIQRRVRLSDLLGHGPVAWQLCTLGTRRWLTKARAAR